MIIFDLPNHCRYNSNHDRVTVDVVMVGVAINSVKDVKVLFNSIPFDKVSVSRTMNGAVLSVMDMIIKATVEQKM